MPQITMLPLYGRQAVLKGYIDGYCFACDLYFYTDDSLDEHLKQLEHLTMRKFIQWFDGFEDDGIMKVKNKYFCGCCNVLLPTIAKLELHVNEEKHLNNKGMYVLNRIDGDVIAFFEVVIPKSAWNGFIGNKCVVCDVEFTDPITHEQDLEHMHKLIESNVLFSKRNIFRKIDENFHCLTCNIIQPMDILETHFKNEEHKMLYSKCKTTKFESTPRKQDKPITKKGVDQVTNGECSKNNMKNVDEVKNEGSSQTNGKEHKKTSEKLKNKVDNGVKNEPSAAKTSKTDEVCKILKAKNYVFKDGDFMMCLLCDLKVESEKEHLMSVDHQVLLKIHNNSVQGKEKLSKEEILQTINDTKAIIFNDVTVKSEEAVCKICSKGLPLEVDLIKAHLNEHKTNKSTKKSSEKASKDETLNEAAVETKPNLAESDTSANEIMQFAVENNLIYDSIKNKVHCEECEKDVTVSYKAMKQHVESILHRNAKSKNPKYAMKVPIKQYLHSCQTTDTVFGPEVVINEGLVLPSAHFLMLTQGSGYMVKCLACDQQIPHRKSVDGHIKSCPESGFANSKVVIMDAEFLREIRPNTYHCGFCNVILKENELKNHLSAKSHEEFKVSCEWKFRRYTAAKRDLQQFEENAKLITMARLFSAFGFE